MPAALFDNLGTLDQYIDPTQMLTFAHSWIQGTVMQQWFMGYLGPSEWIYTADLAMLIAVYAAAAYVAVKTVDAGANFALGYYATYAGSSTTGDRLMFFSTFIFIGGYLFWGLFNTIFATYTASQVWDQLDARLAEAKEFSIGIDTPVNWWLALKTSTLLFLIAFAHVIAGFCLGDEADEIILWFKNYENDTDKEGSQKTGSQTVDLDGTSAEQDILYHTITGVYAMFVLGVLNIGSYVFFFEFNNLNTDGGFGTNCDLEAESASTYAGVPAIVAQISSLETCLAQIQNLFNIIDVNHNNLIERCEDATFQFNMGSTKAYALKYSSQFTREAASQLCYEDWGDE